MPVLAFHYYYISITPNSVLVGGVARIMLHQTAETGELHGKAANILSSSKFQSNGSPAPLVWPVGLLIWYGFICSGIARRPWRDIGTASEKGASPRRENCLFTVICQFHEYKEFPAARLFSFSSVTHFNTLLYSFFPYTLSFKMGLKHLTLVTAAMAPTAMAQVGAWGQCMFN